MTRTLFTNARLLDPAQALDAPGYLLAEDGLITAAGAGSARWRSSDIPDQLRVCMTST